LPLTWEDVNDSLDPKAFTIRTALERIEKLGSDPVLPVLEVKPRSGAGAGSARERIDELIHRCADSIDRWPRELEAY